MKIIEKRPPREYKVGIESQITIKDCGSILLEDNEQITLLTRNEKEYDVAKKDWGFYATPSVNSRLKNQGFKTALVRNSKGQWYIMLVEKDKIGKFQNYLREEKNEVVEWLDEKTLEVKKA
jgi:hypothetical protein